MSYNTKNYTEQGGEVTHFRGKVIFEEGCQIDGLPKIANLPPTATAAQLIAALKEAGYMDNTEPPVDLNIHAQYFDIDENGSISLKSGVDTIPETLQIPAEVDEVAVTSIGDCGARQDVTTVKIPSNVLTIKEDAFLGYENLVRVEIADGVREIEENAFSGCTSLETVIIDSEGISLGRNCFPLLQNLKFYYLGQEFAGLGPLRQYLDGQS